MPAARPTVHASSTSTSSDGVLETVIAPEQFAADREGGNAEHSELVCRAGGFA
jgi:hypothetical protein